MTFIDKASAISQRKPKIQKPPAPKFKLINRRTKSHPNKFKKTYKSFKKLIN